MGEKIKLKTDFFNQDAIDFLLSQKNGCKYIVLYQMLCLQTVNSNGKFLIENAEKIASEKHFGFNTVKVALELFKKLGLVNQNDNNVLSIACYNSMVER